MSPGIVDTASTYGWDTVFAMHIADVNRAIAKAGCSPSVFDVTDPQDNISATGRFGTWQVITGGDNDLVRFGIPVANATIKGLAEGTVTVASAELHVDVRLDFFHAAEIAGIGDLHHLKVRTTPVPGAQKVAFVPKVIFPDPQPSFSVQIALPVLAELWLNENLCEFDHVFATVNLNNKADKAEFQWLQPTDHAYAYSDLGDAGDGALAILCVTQNRSPKGLIQQLSSVAIPVSQRAGFLIAKERILAQMLLPAMTTIFPGTSTGDFTLSPSGDSILNAHQDVTVTLTDRDDKEYKAQLMSLSLRIEGTELQMDVQTKTDLSPGIRAYCHTQNFMAIQLVNKPDGTQTLGFCDSRKALVEHWTDHDPGFIITEVILAVVAVVASLVLAVATAGTTIAITALIIVVVAGLAAAAVTITEKVIEMVGKNDAPSIDAMVLNATAPIVWADSGDFKIELAQLSDSLQLGGTPCFV